MCLVEMTSQVSVGIHLPARHPGSINSLKENTSKEEVSSSAKSGNTHKQRGDPVDAVWGVQGRRMSAGDHKGPHHTVPQTASQYRCTLRKRFVCYQRPHAAWRSKLNNILWNQTRLLDPCLQIG